MKNEVEVKLNVDELKEIQKMMVQALAQVTDVLNDLDLRVRELEARVSEGAGE